jgi:hypothetical protein
LQKNNIFIAALQIIAPPILQESDALCKEHWNEPCLRLAEGGQESAKNPIAALSIIA